MKLHDEDEPLCAECDKTFVNCACDDGECGDDDEDDFDFDGDAEEGDDDEDFEDEGDDE